LSLQPFFDEFSTAHRQRTNKITSPQVNFIYGVSQPFFVGFKKVAPLMVFMAFAGTAITGVLERNTNLDSYFKPLDFIGVGNVECMTMFLVGCTNFFVTKLLLSLGVGKKKD